MLLTKPMLTACGQVEILPAEEFLAFYPQTQLSAEHPFAVPGNSVSNRVVFHRHFEAEDDENIEFFDVLPLSKC